MIISHQSIYKIIIRLVRPEVRKRVFLIILIPRDMYVYLTILNRLYYLNCTKIYEKTLLSGCLQADSFIRLKINLFSEKFWSMC